MGRLDGKSVIITGAAAGMGEAAAKIFGREGAKLTLADINAKDGEATAEAVRKAGGQAIFVETNVTKAADWERLVKKAVATYGGLNVLVDNVGVMSGGKVEEISEEEYERVMNINVKAVWLGMKYAIPELRKAGGGSIVCTGSTQSFAGSKMGPLYAASKGAVLLLVKSAALYLAPDKIRVNLVAPGPTRTKFLGDTPDEKIIEIMTGMVPLGRMGRAEDQANAMLFFASDESSFVTGAGLPVDGGFLAQ